MSATTANLLSRFLFVHLAALTLIGCVASFSGRVDTAAYQPGPLSGTFAVMLADEMSLTDKAISEMISEKMIEHGFEKVAQGDTPNIAVFFSYSLGGAMIGSYWGGVYSTRPWSFQVVLADLSESLERGEVVVLWQGETYSAGRITDIRRIAGYYIDVIFDNFGETVSNRRWMRMGTY